jgi:hypothetical protein
MIKTVLRIHDILVWIRIRILILQLSSLTFKTPPKIKKLVKNFSSYHFLKVPTFTHFSKIKSKKSHKTVEIKVFLIFFLLNDRRIRVQETQKHVDPVDPDSDLDPKHRFKI